ncbi:MAG: heterodisulfide reductase subunit [Eubacteriales bacterium]|nr:heterodisulfide reductase subunit [Eubacteriales bacterium]MDN5363859.1 heterodisulfide reductase subunit [Eubacteriales bacterium]
MKGAGYAVFWGCQIPARLPFMEKSTRLVLDALGIDYVDLEGFTCCPEKSLVKNYSEMRWLLTAARNLAVAERAGRDLLVVCNGCYGTLRAAANRLTTEKELRDLVNEKLATIGLTYTGRQRVRHLIEVFHDEVGPAAIKSRVTKPLTGMRIAVHYGCHMLRPSSAIHFDDPLKPSKFDALVTALGAESIDYHTKMMCCGGALSHVGDEADAMALTRKKLLELMKRQADAMVLVCPACFMQYDQKQYLAQRKGEKIHLPVFTFPELLGLALGIDPAELGLDYHRVDTTDFFRTWEKHLADYELVKRHIDLNAVRRCYECGACVSDCPVAEIKERFDPNRLIGMLLDGRVNELLNSKEIWYCVECHTCYEMCPQKFGMEKVFATLKHLAMERGLMPPSIKGGVDMFLRTGRLGAPDDRTRKKLGLGQLPPDGGEELKRLLEGL